MTDENDRYALALGAAVIEVWGDLPQDVQHAVFEAAVGQAGSQQTLREQLAVFLHDRHPRTH